MLQGIRNLFGLGKDTVLGGIKNLFGLGKDKALKDRCIKDEVFETIRTDNAFSYIEYEVLIILDTKVMEIR